MLYPDLPLWASIAFVVVGLVALAWSSDLFVAGAASLAKALGISPFIIGMVIIGFGTSAPELCVSAMSGLAGKSNLSLGNAYGSCIFNIAAILGLAAVIRPIRTKPATVFVAGPLLALVSLLSMWLLRDGACTRGDALLLLGLFAVLMPLYCWFDQRKAGGAPAAPAPAAAEGPSGGGADSKGRVLAVSAVKLVVGLAVLVGSSHVLVWGAVDLAKAMGVSDLMIGLTIVAVGTSLPELASAVASARRGENEFVLGNIVGSNLFNTLAVVGLASSITAAEGFSRCILTRDLPVMTALSVSLVAFGANWRAFGRRAFGRRGRITRIEGAAWLVAFAAYAAVMICQELAAGRLDGAQ